MLPRDQFQIFGLENFDGPLCTGGCEILVYMAEILVTLSVLREPARIFWNKMCSFNVTDFEKTLLVTLYLLFYPNGSYAKSNWIILPGGIDK